MPRINPIDDVSASPGAKTLLDEIRTAYGSVPNGLRTMAVSPALLRAAVEMSKTLASTLPLELRERIAIAIAEQNGCGYCLSAHTAAGRSIGIADDELTRSRTGESTDPAIAAALTFARELNATRGGVTDDDAAGEAVRENLDIPRHELHGFKTTKPSKARILQQVKVALQDETLKWDPVACAQLDAEMRGYQLPDANFVQDSVMTLAIALEHADKAHLSLGRLLPIMYFS